MDESKQLIFFGSNPMPGYAPYHRRFKKLTPSTNGIQEHPLVITNKGSRFPVSILDFPRDRPRVHPTQKPVALMAYLVKTYSNPGFQVRTNCGVNLCRTLFWMFVWDLERRGLHAFKLVVVSLALN